MINQLPYLLFAFLGIIWGSNFIYMKLASEYFDAMQIVFIRVLSGFIPIVLYALYQKILRYSHIKHIIPLTIVSILATSLYYYGFAKGTSLLPSAIAGILSGSIPLFSFCAAFLFLKTEQLSRTKFVGIIIGFIAIIIIAKPFDIDFHTDYIIGVLFMILGSCSVGLSFVYVKKYIIPLNLPPLALVSYQLGISLCCLIFLIDIPSLEVISINIYTLVGMVLGLGIFGTGIAYIIYYHLIRELGAVKAASATYLPPMVALFIGVIFVGETIILWDYIACLLILISIFLIHKTDKNP